jgi:hypothetical protein
VRYSILFMDPQINDLLAKLGIEAAKQTMQSVIKAWEQRKKKKLSAAENKEIKLAAQSIIQAATMDDVRQYSPTYHRISGAAKKGSAAKKVARKVVIKCGPVKRSGTKPSGERVGVKKSAAKIR